MMERARNWALVVIVALVGCKTPDKYIPQEAGVVEEDGAPPAASDVPVAKLDTSSAADAPSSPAPDLAPATGDTPSAADSPTLTPDAMVVVDTAPAPCTSGTVRCAPSGTAVEMCSSGQWTTKENCPLTCSGAACTAVCMQGVSCTEGIKPCHKGATFCATPTSAPACNDSGVDDSKGGCGGGQVCKNGDCVAPCKSSVACTDGIGPCRKGATFCPTPTSSPMCNDSGADDTKGGCGAGKVCSGGKCGCPSSQYLDGSVCKDKKETEAECARADECLSTYCIGEPEGGSSNLRCCPRDNVSCDGFCVPFVPATQTHCVPTVYGDGPQNYCELPGGRECSLATQQYFADECAFWKPTILEYNIYSISRDTWLTRKTPEKKYFCCRSCTHVSQGDPSCATSAIVAPCR
jgi:hypothetical protein